MVPPPSFVAVGAGVGGKSSSIATSSDGSNWTAIANTDVILTTGVGVAYNGFSRWVAVGGFPNTIATSQDGIEWTNVDSATVLDYVSCVAHSYPLSSPLWVAVGYQLNGGTNTIATSQDGINWKGIVNSNNILSTGYGVATNAFIWVAVGEYFSNSIATSTNGTDWSGITGNTIFSDAGRGVVFNTFLNLWVAVGSGTNTFAYSTTTNGTAWTGVSNTIFTIGNAVATNTNTNMFVAVGSGGTNSIAYSQDGINWKGVDSSNTIFKNGTGVAWSGNLNLWVAVGSSGVGTNTIATSQDGIIWKVIDNKTSIDFSAVASIFNTIQIFNQATVGKPSAPLQTQGPPPPPITIFSYTPASNETITSYTGNIYWFSNSENGLFYALDLYDSTNTTQLIGGVQRIVGDTAGEYFNFTGSSGSSGGIDLIGGTTYNFSIVRGDNANGDIFNLAVVVVGFDLEYTGNITINGLPN